MKNGIKILALWAALSGWNSGYGQDIPLPADLPQGHPRLMTSDGQKPELERTLAAEPWAKEVLDGIQNRIDPYVARTEKQPDWMLSRLMMYWKSRATDVYIRGGVYSHADGQAPVPTVRFGSTRGVGSPYKRPKLEQIVPYMDDTRGVYFLNTDKEGPPLEWVEQSAVSGGAIESVNEEILKHARDAAFLWWLTGKEEYARFAYGIIDTYLTGIYYRNVPVDLAHGHAQTLVGMSTFEVIQERVLNHLAYAYDFLYGYVARSHPEKHAVYQAALKKWIDVTIAHGVPHNNWNLHQAKFILKVAMVLEDNGEYPDGKGRGYYIDYILNRSSARQWSLQKFAAYGYDPQNGIWNECPGYAVGVTRDMTNFIRDYDNTFDQNLLPYLPVMYDAVKVLPQYLFPNGQTTAFGDTYYGPLSPEAAGDMVRMAQKYGDREREAEFTAMYLFLNGGTQQQSKAKPDPQIESLFTTRPLALDPEVNPGRITDYATPTFYAPNVSWLVQRNKYDDPENGLMISQYASYGNHAHSNGVAIELYGKGYVLGAESGIGSTYFEKPYLEYYSQFPAHNTVMVDGVSKYPEMLSDHPFDLLGCYPAPGRKSGYYPGMTFCEVGFLEPETRSDQNRLTGIVSTGERSGYYIDIFHSKRQQGGDKFHDYFYHNLGQEMVLADAHGNPLALEPSAEMAFAGGHLFALDYMWDKRSAKTADDYTAVWKMHMPDGTGICMNLWMKGSPGREVFSIKAPPCKAFRQGHGLPYQVDKEPYLTLAARQHGAAWDAPFAAVFEPCDGERSISSIASFSPRGASPSFVGITVESRTGRTDRIFSSPQSEIVSHDGITVQARYAVVSRQGNDFVLFLGKGTRISAYGVTVASQSDTSAIVEFRGGKYYFTCDGPVTLTVAGKTRKMKATDYGKL